MREQEGRDEEERINVESLRQSGQLIEPRKSQDIPFGVRAIHSGIQVDGIWQSKGSTPMPASIRFSHIRNSSSDLSGNQSPSPRASLDISQAARPPSTRGRSSFRPSELGISHSGQSGIDESKAYEVRGHRPSYKPQRSSHLRYGDHREPSYNEDTLDQLEGNEQPEQERSQRTRGTQDAEIEVYASAAAVADNECSSGSETDVALSLNLQAKPYLQHQSLPFQHFGRNFLSAPSTATASRSPQVSLPSQSANVEYFPLPVEPPENGKSDQFSASLPGPVETPLPKFRPPYAQTVRELRASGESQVPLLSLSRSPSPFIPGELHMNKAMRKVNSGFEVLPAGTFGIPAEFKGKGIGREDRRNQDDDSGEKGYSDKLQKRIRTSMSSRRPSSTFEGS